MIDWSLALALVTWWRSLLRLKLLCYAARACPTSLYLIVLSFHLWLLLLARIISPPCFVIRASYGFARRLFLFPFFLLQSTVYSCHDLLHLSSSSSSSLSLSVSSIVHMHSSIPLCSHPRYRYPYRSFFVAISAWHCRYAGAVGDRGPRAAGVVGALGGAAARGRWPLGGGHAWSVWDHIFSISILHRDTTHSTTQEHKLTS